MDIDFEVGIGYGSHDFEEPAQKRQRLDHDPSYPPASNIPRSTIGQLDSWYQNANDNQQLDSEELWMVGFHDSQNIPSTWSSTVPQFTSYSNGDRILGEPTNIFSDLSSLHMRPPTKTQENYDDPVAEGRSDGDVAEESAALFEKDDQNSICFGMVESS
jgi:hypothetical protein